MSALAAEKKNWTVEEYLAMESASLDKHEFFGGEIFLHLGVQVDTLVSAGGWVSGVRLGKSQRVRPRHLTWSSIGPPAPVTCPDLRL